VDDTSNGNSLHPNCSAVNSKSEFTLICLVLHQIACGLSYFAFSMHGIGICGILITTFGLDDANYIDLCFAMVGFLAG
jgi:hypothetical protein